MISDQHVAIINASLLKYAPTRIGVFGSRLRGEETEKSDLDILIKFSDDGNSPYSLLELLSVERSLGRALGFPVDIINEKTIKNENLRRNILNDLIIIYQQQ